mmetsp:Transcript_18131/g.46415  ORF Transcript_18131/g.46415 Transcript_18131/m.46415 type:complete len:322 (+) Transcript_18131:351-1316(+)
MPLLLVVEGFHLSQRLIRQQRMHQRQLRPERPQPLVEIVLLLLRPYRLLGALVGARKPLRPGGGGDGRQRVSIAPGVHLHGALVDDDVTVLIHLDLRRSIHHGSRIILHAPSSVQQVRPGVHDLGRVPFLGSLRLEISTEALHHVVCQAVRILIRVRHGFLLDGHNLSRNGGRSATHTNGGQQPALALFQLQHLYPVRHSLMHLRHSCRHQGPGGPHATGVQELGQHGLRARHGNLQYLGIHLRYQGQLRGDRRHRACSLPAPISSCLCFLARRLTVSPAGRRALLPARRRGQAAQPRPSPGLRLRLCRGLSWRRGSRGLS